MTRKRDIEKKKMPLREVKRKSKGGDEMKKSQSWLRNKTIKVLSLERVPY